MYQERVFTLGIGSVNDSVLVLHGLDNLPDYHLGSLGVVIDCDKLVRFLGSHLRKGMMEIR